MWRLQQLLSTTIFQDCIFKDPFLYFQHLWLTNSSTNKQVPPCMKFEYLCSIKFVEYNNINKNLFTLLWIYKQSFFFQIEKLLRTYIDLEYETQDNHTNQRGVINKWIKAYWAQIINGLTHQTLNKWMTKNATINDLKA